MTDPKKKTETAQPFSEELGDTPPPSTDHPNATPDGDRDAEKDGDSEKKTRRTE